MVFKTGDHVIYRRPYDGAQYRAVIRDPGLENSGITFLVRASPIASLPTYRVVNHAHLERCEEHDLSELIDQQTNESLEYEV